jgi:endonuclease G
LSGLNIYAQNINNKIKDIDYKIDYYYKTIDSLKAQKEDFLLQYIRQNLKQTGLPKLKTNEKLIMHSAYALVYAEKYEQAKWVAHIILPEIAKGAVGRTNDFRPDSMISTGSAIEQDYFLKSEVNGKTIYDGFGYDRGHLAPSADFRWSKKALSESYYYSNMSPQVPEFNRGAWAKLEGILRSYVIQNNTPLFIVTGPVLKPGLKTIERSVNKVKIPDYFFKIAYDNKNQKAIAFLMPNEDIQYPIETYAVSIDSIEKITGIDFFYTLPDSIENKIEKSTNYKPFLTGSAKK